MPLYAYACTNCGYEVEKLETLQSLSIQDCEKCKKNKTLLRKLSAPSSIAFTGGGWYKDAYSKPTPKS